MPVKERHARIAANSSLSNNNMQVGASYTVGELIELIAVPSSAAATYMLMDLLAPDIDTFVKMMNKKAKELGMVNTRYVNPIGVLNVLLGKDGPSGDPYADNYTTAHDYACLCTYLVTNYPDLLKHTKNANLVSKPGTIYEEHFEGHNYSLAGEKYAFPGADGIKTGSARKGYNYSLTAKQGNTRMIEIILGVSVWEDELAESMRHPIGNSILEDAFAKYEYRKLLSAGTYSVKGKIIRVKKTSTTVYQKIINRNSYATSRPKRLNSIYQTENISMALPSQVLSLRFSKTMRNPVFHRQMAVLSRS